MFLPVRIAATLCLLLAMTAAPLASAHEEPEIDAMTSDGRMVILYEDHTWDFVEAESGDPANSAVLTVTEVKEMQDACGLQLRLQNNLPHKIRSIVPRFSVYNKDNIVFDSKSQSFTAIKPTRNQYKRIQFTGIGCHEIRWVRVHDAARCTIGEVVDMFNEEEGQCLSYIYVEPSEMINISKEPRL
ncbi:MAG: hypothetical protein CME59_04910 [Halioglobus sp.]|nr:hypothetical protein [Halioglobus sp.]|tara:strand:+ start:4872 stop:5429 length:558 start_codon:yes stop_codon:yes gene_type:complete